MQDGERQVVLRRVGDTQIVAALYHTMPEASPDFVAMDALTEIMTVAPSGRLYRALVDTNLASTVEGDNWGMHDPGVVMFFAQVAGDGSLAKARDAMLAALEGVAAQPITAAEIERVRARALNEFERIISSPQAFGRVPLRLDREWRLAAVLPRARPLAHGQRRRRATRRDGVSQAVEPHSR